MRDGEFDKFRGFMPTPSEFAEIVRNEQRSISEDLARARAKMEALTPEPVVEKSAEARARVRALREAFLAEHKADLERRHPAAVPEVFDEDRAEYFSRIMALKDAPVITAEQTAERNKRAAQIASAAKQEQAA